MYKIFVILVILLSVVSAQENWDIPWTIDMPGGGSVDLCNPSFDGETKIVVETENYGFYDQFKIVYYDLTEPYPTPQLFPDSINLDGYHYISPFVSYDSTKLYFSSDLPGGYGGFDLWVSERLGDLWSSPVNLGPAINTALNESGASLPLAESEIYFFRNSSTGMPDGLAYYESDAVIFASQKIEGTWSDAAPLPQPINVGYRSCEPHISSDGQKLYFTATRPDSTTYLAYVAYRDNENWQEPVRLNENINMVYHDEWPGGISGNVFSVGTDRLNVFLTFYYMYVFSGCPCGDIRLSELAISIDDPSILPKTIDLTVYPNPFNTSANIEFTMASAGRARLDIFDIGGRHVATLLNRSLAPGICKVRWNAGDQPSGVYFIRLTTDRQSRVAKAILLK